MKLQQIEWKRKNFKGVFAGCAGSESKALDTRLESSPAMLRTDDENLITELNKKYRAYESDIQSNLGKIGKSQEKLRAVKTNKEYQSSLKEIDDIKAINSKLEDEMLEFLEQIETG